MIRKILVLSFCLAAINAQASEPAKVMLFGTFHFQDAGLDTVKVDDVNVMDEASQAYLSALAQRLAEFKPTRVLLEYLPANNDAINLEYQAYLADEFELPVNEIYQMGFRIARAAGNPKVYGIDNREVAWQAEPMFEYAEQHDSPQMAAFNQIIARYTEEEKQARAEMGLGDLLKRSNDAQEDRLNMDLYLATNSIGAGDGFSGADAAASWWRRNFRMYANIQSLAEPGERLLVIAGSGHTAILKTFLDVDSRIQSVEVTPFL